MADKKLTVTKQTGFTAYEIAGYVLKQNDLNNVIEQCRCKTEEWIKDNNNNDYRFADGSEINIPDLEDIKKLNDTFCVCKDGKSGTSCQCGWKLTITGKLVRGRTGWLTDENGLYILKDGRRLFEKQIKNKKEELCIGKEDIWEGLNEILGKFRKPPQKKNKYNTKELIRDYGPHMSEVVFQAFQINICYTQKKQEEWNTCTRKKGSPDSQKTTSAKDCMFRSIGSDETGIPIVVTRIGKEKAQNKLVIAGPHGDERNAQRLIMAAQKHFIQNGAPADMSYYFIPCISPTMAFADARGIPVVKVDESGKVIERFAASEILDKVVLTIPYLHDLLAKKITACNLRTKSEVNGVLMREAIQNSEYNSIAFASYNDYKNNNIDKNYPKYGIDANRDVGLWLNSTNQFLAFIKKLKGNASGENIKVIMVHGYIHGGGVYGTYKINKDLTVNLVSDDAKYYAYAFWQYLINDIPKNYFPGTESAPLNFAGEWSQLLYNKHKILTIDIELPKKEYDEGRRGDEKEEEYKSEKVREDFDGILGPKNKNFYDLLKKYFVIIDDYKHHGGTVNK